MRINNSVQGYVLVFCIALVCSCGASESSKGYHFNGQITVDGLRRTYVLALPPAYYDSDTTFALVLGLHGTGGSANQFERDYGLTAKANREGFIVAYPEGVRSDGPLGIRTWNAGECCDYAMQQNIGDVNFIRVLIDELQERYKINPRRIYATGMSNGAMMVYRLACEMSDKLAAIAPVSGTLMTDRPCTPSRPMPVLHIHSAADTKVPPHGGIGLAGYYFHPVDSALTVFTSLNGCIVKAVSDKGTYLYTTWDACNENTTIEYYLTTDGGHAWPGGHPASIWADEPSRAVNADDLIWDFFKRFVLP